MSDRFIPDRDNYTSMRGEILSAVERRNMFLAPDAYKLVEENNEPMAFINSILNAMKDNQIFITKQDVLDFMYGDKGTMKEEKYIKPAVKFCSDIHVVDSTDITGKSTCTGVMKDFSKYFQDRYRSIKRILESNRKFGQSMPLAKALSYTDREVHVVGIIYSKNTYDNKSIGLKIEDDQGTVCNVYIPADSPASKNIFIEDQVIGIIGTPRKNKDKDKPASITASEIINPDVPETNAWQNSDSDSTIAFLSDVHIGSTTFLEKSWQKMIRWMKEASTSINLNYVVFPGDVVDGIGVFPDQEKELSIADIYEQYEALAEYLKDIPDHIKMVVHPGNHDAVRPAEPQPALNDIFTKTFDSNVILCGNPVYVEAECRKVLTYHGRSIDDWVSNVQQLTYNDPIAVMKQMVVMRHLAPLYGQKTALAPEEKDYLVMNSIPDIFVSGHVHGAGHLNYRGIRMINASTWQDQTDYQKNHNFNPEPAIMPVVHLGNGTVKMMNFRT